MSITITSDTTVNANHRHLCSNFYGRHQPPARHTICESFAISSLPSSSVTVESQDQIAEGSGIGTPVATMPPKKDKKKRGKNKVSFQNIPALTDPTVPRVTLKVDATDLQQRLANHPQVKIPCVYLEDMAVRAGSAPVLETFEISKEFQVETMRGLLDAHHLSGRLDWDKVSTVMIRETTREHSLIRDVHEALVQWLSLIHI